MTNRNNFESTNTDPIRNYIKYNKFVTEYKELCFRLDTLGSPVESMKKLFGKQDFCWIGGDANRRFHVWHIEELWILANNNNGIYVEVDAGIEKIRAECLWNNLMLSVRSKTILDNNP